jgi:D-glycerate 3-kinase
MNIPASIYQPCQSLIQEMRLPNDFLQVIEKIYYPLARKLQDSNSTTPILVSINGAQGTGKSTLTKFLKIILESLSSKPVAAFSIDDFYLTREQRKQLAKDIHPLFITRGVPGTHDLDLMISVINDLMQGKATEIPAFDKAIDDRDKRENWQKTTGPVDFILFEGWCMLSPPQTAEELLLPINKLEVLEDADGLWRQYANQQLQAYHQQLFSRTGISIMLQPPDFEHVYQWRNLQEDKLRQSSTTVSNHKIMDEKALNRFIQHYERISRHSLATLPSQVDYLLPVDEYHNITGIIEKNGLQ